MRKLIIVPGPEEQPECPKCRADIRGRVVTQEVPGDDVVLDYFCPDCKEKFAHWPKP